MVISRNAAMDTEAVQTTNNSIIALAIRRIIVNCVLDIKEYITRTTIVSKPLSKVKKHFFACCTQQKLLMLNEVQSKRDAALLY
jgi:hypothetical protein